MAKIDGSRHILITGATDGIGLHLLNCFAQQGYTVAGTGSRPSTKLPNNWPKNALYIRADQSDAKIGELILKKLSKNGWNKLDNLVLNAGTGWIGSPQEEPLEIMQRTLSVNLEAPISIAWQLASMLKKSDKGQLTLIGSTARNGHPDFATYTASKAGLVGFGRALASEWQGMTQVQVIDPGPTATTMHQKAGMKQSIIQRLFMSPELVAERIHELINLRKPKARIGRLDIELFRIRKTFQAGG